MKKILILSRTLSNGGVPNALVAFLQYADLSDCDLTIGIEFNRIDLASKLDSRIRVVAYNETSNKSFNKLMHIRDKISRTWLMFFVWKFLNLLEKKHTKHNIKKLFGKHIYDSAIAFHQGNATKYVSKYIKAKKKVYFYHAERIMNDCREKYFLNGDYIVCSSLGVVNMLKSNWKRIDSNKLKLCHYVVNYQSIRDKAKEFANMTKKSLSLITVGRLVDDKGYDLLIDTAIKLKSMKLDFIWNVFGDGPLIENLKNLVNSNYLSDNVVFYGGVSNPYKYIAKSDILVSTSKHEAFGLVISEAQILGKTVIATKTSGALEQIVDGKNGYLVKYNSSELSEKIVSLFYNRDKMHYVEKKLKTINYEKYNEKCIETFEQLAF